MKSFGAKIFCSVCQAQPYPDSGSGFRETFSLTRVGGEWLCDEHRPLKKERALRVAAATPAEALNEFERTLAAESSRLEEAVAGCDDYSLAIAIKDFGEELERALNELKKAVVAQAPPRAEKAAQNKRARPKPISARERDHEGQGELIDNDQKREGA
jgi:hypothetical protein